MRQFPGLTKLTDGFQAANNPSKMFVQKSNDHRGIQIKNLDDIELDRPGSFVQEFVANPLLIDGYKFDIGVYTTVTSFDPLRVYIYNGDALLRSDAFDFK